MSGPSASLTRIVQGLILRGEITLIDDTTALRSVRVATLDGDLTECEHVEPFGLTGRPAVGGEAIIARVAGTSHSVALAAWDRSERPTGLAAGDVTLYDGHGHRIDLKAAGVAINTDTAVTGSLSGTTVHAGNGATGAGQPSNITVVDGVVTSLGTIGPGGTGLTGTVTFHNEGVPGTVISLTLKDGMVTGKTLAP
ncbi:MAG: phage baseplate assembly protein [Deltaproteobacteria bacterium]|nr:phage baseplate assembly protein [Deltaproteobacteria bacterium]